MRPQQGSLEFVVSSSGAVNLCSGGSPLAGVKYTVLGLANSSVLGGSWGDGRDVASGRVAGGSSSEGVGRGGGGAGYLLSLAAARWRFRSAKVWWDFSRLMSPASPSPGPNAELSW